MSPSQPSFGDMVRMLDAHNRPNRLDPTFTHRQLVDRACSWLRRVRHCGVVLRETVSSCNEIPDAIGWWNGVPIVVECKVSIADFKANADKPSQRAGRAMGWERWFLVPANLAARISEDGLLPGGFGLLGFDGRRIRKVTSAPQGCAPGSERNEVRLLVSVLRRYQAQGITYRKLETPAEQRAAAAQFEIDAREARQLMGLEARS